MAKSKKQFGPVTSTTSLPRRITDRVPWELWLVIFQFLEKVDLKALSLTCKSLHAELSPVIFETFRILDDSTNCLRALRNNRKLAGYIRHLTINIPGRGGLPFDDASEKFLLQAIPYLRNVRFLMWDSSMAMSTLVASAFSRHCPLIRGIGWIQTRGKRAEHYPPRLAEYFPKIDCYTVGYRRRDPDSTTSGYLLEQVQAFLKANPNGFRELKLTTPDGHLLQELPRPHPNLERFAVREQAWGKELSTIFGAGENLTSIALFEMWAFENLGQWMDSCPTFPRLRAFKISQADLWGGVNIPQFAGFHFKIRDFISRHPTLDTIGVRFYNEEVALTVAEAFPSLTRLKRVAIAVGWLHETTFDKLLYRLPRTLDALEIRGQGYALGCPLHTIFHALNERCSYLSYLEVEIYPSEDEWDPGYKNGYRFGLLHRASIMAKACRNIEWLVTECHRFHVVRGAGGVLLHLKETKSHLSFDRDNDWDW